MEQFSLYQREAENADAFTDLLFNTLLGFAFMFFIAFVLINPEATTGKIDTNAEFIITVTWPDSHPDDIDTYVEDPAGNLVWYHAREAGLMHLDRDDRGNYRDTILVNGEKVVNPLNQETVTVRGIVPGEYVVNVFHYLATSPEPVPVSVKVEKINPQVTVLYYETLELEHTGDEVTAARFNVLPDGDVSDVNTRQKSLAKLARKAKRSDGPTQQSDDLPPQLLDAPQGIELQQ